VGIALVLSVWCSGRPAIAQDAQPLPPLPPPSTEPAPLPAVNAPPAQEVAPTPSSTVTAGAATLSPPGHVAEPSDDVPPRFGTRGQFVLSGTSAIGASHYEYDNSEATGSLFEFSPGADYFVARNVSIGIDADASYFYSQGYTIDGTLNQSRTTRFALAPRVGLNLPMGRMLSLYPRFTLGYESISALETGPFGSGAGLTARTSESGAFVEIFVPLLFHPIPRFYFGFGPDFFHHFGEVTGGPTSGGQATTVGVSFVVGAYWGGAPAAADEAPRRPPRHRQFGEAGEFVLTNAIQSGFHFTTVAGGDLHSSGFGDSPTLDFFVANHVSLGLGMNILTTQDKGVDLLTRTPSETDSSSVSVHGIIGLDAPIAEGLSLYPRAYLGIESQSFDRTIDATSSTENDTVVYTGIEMPLLVHPGPHVFVGLGPEVAHELSRAVTFTTTPGTPPFQNRRTIVDGFLIVGGWF
jgi:hypothetical protein